MEIIIQPTPEAASGIAARMVARLLREKPDAVLGLATGSTPLLLCQELVPNETRLEPRQDVQPGRIRRLGTAEPPGQLSHASCGRTCSATCNIAESNVHIPDGLAGDVPGFCQSYEQQIHSRRAVSIGSCWALGTDGHIGFNEPTSSLASRTRIKTLTQRTRADNARFFGGEAAVPHHVITMGIGTIMEARQCLLLAFGKKKARAVAEAVEGPITAMNPASVQQLHPVAKTVLDEPAASQLRKADYYRWVYDNNPDWQKA